MSLTAQMMFCLDYLLTHLDETDVTKYFMLLSVEMRSAAYRSELTVGIRSFHDLAR